MGMYVSEDGVNLTEHYRYGDPDVYETACDTPAEVYRALLKQHVGRCVGKVYVDMAGAGNSGLVDAGGHQSMHVGWTFVRREKYEDTGGTYLLETWVTLHSAPPTKSIEYHYVKVT